MTNSLIYVSLMVLALTFGVITAVIVLRFLTVLQQLKRADSMDRSELMRELDASHVQAFTNALTALTNVHERVAVEQASMFGKTMDMVHGPQRTDETAGGDYAVDAGLDMRQVSVDVEMDDTDPTDDDTWLAMTNDVMADTQPKAVSVRPGETLVPNG